MIGSKPHRQWWTTGSDGERSNPSHTFPTVSPPSRKDEGHDGVGLSFTRQILQTIQVEKVGTQKRRKMMKCYDKVCNRPPTWADDDRTDWTMKTTTEDTRY